MRKECLRVIGMEGTGKDQIRLNPPLVDEIQTNLAFLHVPRLNPPLVDEIQTNLAFLHVPIPTALRPSHSSSSLLATNTLYPI